MLRAAQGRGCHFTEVGRAPRPESTVNTVASAFYVSICSLPRWTPKILLH